MTAHVGHIRLTAFDVCSIMSGWHDSTSTRGNITYSSRMWRSLPQVEGKTYSAQRLRKGWRVCAPGRPCLDGVVTQHPSSPTSSVALFLARLCPEGEDVFKSIPPMERRGDSLLCVSTKQALQDNVYQIVYQLTFTGCLSPLIVEEGMDSSSIAVAPQSLPRMRWNAAVHPIGIRCFVR